MRNLFSYIPQKPFFIQGTVKENIILDQKTNISNKKIYEIIRLVDLDYLIKKLPEGINSVIAQDGSTLSGGEQQKLTQLQELYILIGSALL